MEFKDQFEQYGHARVLVVLKPVKEVRVGGQLALDHAGTYTLQQQAANDIGYCFKAFSDSRETQIAREMASLSMARSAPRRSTLSKGMRYYANLGVVLGTVDEAGLKSIRSRTREISAVMPPPEFGLIRPVEDMALAGAPTGTSWGVERMNAEKVWQQGITGKGVVVGHVDTGVDAAHDALTDAIDAFVELDELGEVKAGAAARDSGQHGTHTAGIIAGRKFNGLKFGVAPGAKLASAMVIEGGDVIARVLGGLDWCVGQDVRIISMSLGLRGFMPQFRSIMALLRQRNILPVVAVGNEGVGTSRSPGNYPESLSVGAMDVENMIWFNSSSDRFTRKVDAVVPDVIAPGAGIWSSIPGNQLAAMSGTSMAAPHIAGLAALLLEHRPDITAAKLEAAIFKSCTRPPGISTARGNRGFPDAAKAVKALSKP
jgi:subtilisin family serine protease